MAIEASQVAGIVDGIGALAGLAAKLITADKEATAGILADMRTELLKMSSTLEEGGSMDKAIAAADERLDKVIAEAEAAIKP